MKDAFSLLLCCILTTSLVGCGKSAEEKKEEEAQAAREKHEKIWREQGKRENEALKKLLR